VASSGFVFVLAFSGWEKYIALHWSMGQVEKAALGVLIRVFVHMKDILGKYLYIGPMRSFTY